MNHLKISFTLLLATVLLASCYRDTKTCKCAREQKFNFENECRDVEQHNDDYGLSTVISYKYEGTQRFGPHFKKDDEMLYFTMKGSDSYFLVSADLRSGKHYFERYVPRQLTWYTKVSPNGEWIYDRTNGTICKTDNPDSCVTNDLIRTSLWCSDSKSLMGFADPGNIFDDDLRREFRIEYEGYYLFKLAIPNLDVKHLTYLEYREDGRGEGESNLALSGENELAIVTGNQLHILNMNTWKERVVFESEANIGILQNRSQLMWHPNNNDMYLCVEDEGIFKIRKNENKQYRIKKSCPSRHYEVMTLTPDGDQIIAQRRDIKAERDGTYISENTKLVIMDIDGCNEKVLFEDWDGEVVGLP